MNGTLEAHTALLVHGHERQLSVMTIHSIRMHDGIPSLDAGRILSAEESNELGARMMGERSASRDRWTFNPPTLLASEGARLTWYRPASRCTMHWRLSQGRVTVSAVIPSLLFHVHERHLYVAAFAGEDRPSERTQLYHAPLGNVYASGEVCVGGVALPRDAAPSTMDAWERVLLASNFTHINHESTLAAHTTTEDLIAFWTRRERYKTPPHPRLLSELGTAMHWLSSADRAHLQ